MRVVPLGWQTHVKVFAEGVDAHDPSVVEMLERNWKGFVEGGWGRVSVISTEVKAAVVSGTLEDGAPATQLVVMPRIDLLGMRQGE